MFFKKKRPEPVPEPQIRVDLVHTYRSMDRFKGTKRLIISVYGDREQGEEHVATLLGDANQFDSPGTDITLTSFRHSDGSGIKVAVDGQHIGVCWGPAKQNERSPEYHAAYTGAIDGVFVRIEREHPYLFVKMAE